ncbi:hypothetical protein RFI_38110 [Reticulomyxa filosa]|uniref:Uncharacterized protein n=1 Tax=Reticulomyxa filosa TaxID=46433 RepID=X6LE59_RETFI|nr:hypothetical protein RFI_38110 [Reticulomyxa filosa]|eukprot:ETN99371.1 hypothetical protein RFI_38110 [Reticulomyxa filosa]
MERLPNNAKQAIQEKNICIGFNVAKCEYFDKFRSRPRSHFHQRKNCFGLNYFTKDCVKKNKCKFAEQEKTVIQLFVLSKLIFDYQQRFSSTILVRKQKQRQRQMKQTFQTNKKIFFN